MTPPSKSRLSSSKRRLVTVGCLGLGLLYADAFVAIVSCGPDGGSTSYVDAGTTVDAALVDGGLVVDSSVTNDGAAGDGGGDGAIVIGPGGAVTIRQFGSVQQSSWYAIASFAEAYASVRPPVGSCAFSEVPKTDGGSSSGDASVVPPNAGDITVNSPLLDGGAVLRVRDGGVYGTFSALGKIFDNAETLTASAAGGTIPAFNTSVTAPHDIVLTAPALPADGGQAAHVSFPRDQNLVFTWTGGGAGNVFAGLSVNAPTRYTYVYCLFAASAGTGTVPAAMLGRLDRAGAGQTDPQGSISLTPHAFARTQAGAYAVELQVESNAVFRNFDNSN